MQSKQPELLVVHGRRRVGKTYLVREYLGKQIAFEITGLHNEPLSRQLENFANRINERVKEKMPQPKSWLEAFDQLKRLLRIRKPTAKRVIFFDEFPWLASRRSGFLAAFEEFWNSFGSRDQKLVCIICGSAASWMIDKVLNSRGGLHNRTTSQIRLQPFTLSETREFLQYQKVKLSNFQIAQLYMAVGGIPHYLQRIERGKSAAQNIDAMCFSKDSLLANEFDNLYRALFQHPDRHEKVVRTLAKRRSGLTRQELAAATSFASGGTLTKVINELVQSGFVMRVPALHNQRKNSLYRLIDEYSLFYLSWVETNRMSGANIWMSKSSGQKWKSWCGYAFENLCFRHILQIKKSLGISGIITEEASWTYRARSAAEEGAQIDLVIDRTDHCINVCEMKFTDAPFVIGKKYAGAIQQKLRVFREKTNTPKATFVTMVTANGVKENQYASELVSNQVLLEDLFEQ